MANENDTKTSSAAGPIGTQTPVKSPVDVRYLSPHTPGPWEWWTSNSWYRLTSKDSEGRWLREGNVLCPAIASDGHPILIVSEEDMALIAAAPDMLAALRLASETLGNPGLYSNWPVAAARIAINDAIAKAQPA